MGGPWGSCVRANSETKYVPTRPHIGLRVHLGGSVYGMGFLCLLIKRSRGKRWLGREAEGTEGRGSEGVVDVTCRN